MAGNRVTVSLDEESEDALAELQEGSGESRSELIRRAVSFYAANFESATASDSGDLQTYYQMLSTGEHVLLDVDFLHAFLDYVDPEDRTNSEFADRIDQIAEYHAREYAERFESLGDILEWLSLCGFLTVRQVEGDSYHVVFPSESNRWFMTRFIEGSVTELPFELEIEESVSKVLLKEV